MKSHKITAGFVIVIASCLTSMAPAQERLPDGTTRPQDTKPMAAVDLTQGVYLASSDAEAHGLRRYDGQKLLNTQGAELGTIKDLIVHPQSSRVLYLVASSGGIAGMGNSLRLVPVETVRRTSRGLEVEILKGEWLQVPPFNDKNYVADRFDISASQHQMMVQQFGGANAPSRPVTTIATDSVGTPAQFNGLLRASALRGKDIRAEENQSVGEIENVIVDLERGTAAALIDAAGEFTGLRAKYIVPLSRLVMDNAKQDPIATTLTRADFNRAQPGNFATIGGTAAREMRAADEQPLTPTGRPTDAANQVSDTLAASVRAVRDAINDDPAFAAERVQVSAANGRVVLTGSVRNETTRKSIEDAARRTVTTGIDNRITVENR